MIWFVSMMQGKKFILDNLEKILEYGKKPEA